MAFHEIKIGSKSFTLAPAYIKGPDSAELNEDYGFLLFKHDDSDSSICKLYSPGVYDLPIIKYSGGNLCIEGKILPITNNQYSVGSSNQKFNTIYATTFHGNLNGPVQTTTTSTSASYYISFVNGSSSGMRYSYVDSHLYYNPSTNELSVPKIKYTSTGGSWISGKTLTNNAFYPSNNFSATAFFPILAAKTSGENVITLGGLGDQYGFFGYKKDTTENKTDWHFKWDSNNGNTYVTGKIYGTATNADNAETASAALGVRITNTKPTSALTYYITFVSGFASGTNYDVRANDGIKYFTREGSAKQVGIATLAVGNDIAEETAGNKQGCIRIYGTNTGFGNITGPDITNGITFYLPNTAGTFVTHATRGTAVGGAAKPVYIASTGRATACSSTVGGTAKPVYMNAGTITNCIWGTSMSSTTYYYLMGVVSSTAGLTYNTNIKVYSNAIYASSGFYESSDERLKDFQEDIEVNFSYLHNIPKKYYSWKDDATYTRHIGTSAQEVQKYYPELVNTDETGYLTMNYDKLSVVALKAIDVLHEEVTELKKENTELKERLARLEELILNR